MTLLERTTIVYTIEALWKEELTIINHEDNVEIIFNVIDEKHRLITNGVDFKYTSPNRADVEIIGIESTNNIYQFVLTRLMESHGLVFHDDELIAYEELDLLDQKFITRLVDQYNYRTTKKTKIDEQFLVYNIGTLIGSPRDVAVQLSSNNAERKQKFPEIIVKNIRIQNRARVLENARVKARETVKQLFS